MEIELADLDVRDELRFFNSLTTRQSGSSHNVTNNLIPLIIKQFLKFFIYFSFSFALSFWQILTVKLFPVSNEAELEIEFRKILEFNNKR